MPGVDRRFKLLKDGLPGAANFAVSALSDGDLIRWDATDGKWVIAEYVKQSALGGIQIESPDSTENAIFYQANTGAMVLNNLTQGGISYLYGTPTGGGTNALAVFDPDGTSDFYSAGALRAQLDTNRLRLFSNSDDSATGGIFIEWKGSDDVRWGWAGFGTSNGILRIENEHHGGELHLYAENTGGSAEPLALFDPDGASEFYHTGILALFTRVDGIGVQDTSGNDPLVRFFDDTGTVLSRVQHFNDSLFLWNETNGGRLTFRVLTTGGSTLNPINCDPDGSAEGIVTLFDHTTFGTTGRVGLFSGGNGDSGDLDQASGGLLLYSNAMNTTSKHTPALMFGSSDTAFTTHDPKTLAGIVGRATQAYSADTTGGMGIAFYAADGNPGASPTLTQVAYMTASGTTFGNPTGGANGVGTVNAKAVYDDNVLLTCLPVEEAVGRAEGRAVWDNIFPQKRNLMVDQYEQDKLDGFDGTAAGWKALMEARGSVPGLPNRQEIARRWATREERRVEIHPELGETEIVESVNDKMGLSEISNRQWLALDYMAVALRDALSKIERLEEQLNGNRPIDAQPSTPRT